MENIHILQKAVLCYFPYCDRNQGVDYTGTELDIQFGRVITENKKGTVKTKIKSIDDNKQTEEGQATYEEEARDIFRKWDNVKRICEQIKKKMCSEKGLRCRNVGHKNNNERASCIKT